MVVAAGFLIFAPGASMTWRVTGLAIGAVPFVMDVPLALRNRQQSASSASSTGLRAGARSMAIAVGHTHRVVPDRFAPAPGKQHSRQYDGVDGTDIEGRAQQPDIDHNGEERERPRGLHRSQSLAAGVAAASRQ